MAWMAALVGKDEIIAEAADLRELFTILVNREGMMYGEDIALIRIPPFEGDSDGFTIDERGIVVEEV